MTDSSLFAPTRFAGLDLTSATAMAPMTRFRSPSGAPDADVVEYYRRRAAGGIGLIITEGILLDHPSAGAEADAPRLERPATRSGWADVVRTVHGEGGRILAQLWHQGSERDTADGDLAWTPSGVREDGTACGHAMTLVDVDVVIGHYVHAARSAQSAGFDGVEVHAAHGYLLDEFLWSRTNRRTDDYGGSAASRTRIVAEIIEAIREATGPRFPVSVRFSQFKEREFRATLADDPSGLAEILEPMVHAGATAIHASTRRVWEPGFAGSERTLAGWARTITGLPTIAVGSVGLRQSDLQGDGPMSLAALERLHDAGEFDVLALGRVLLANPDWVRIVSGRTRGRLLDYEKAHEGVFP